MPQSVIFKIYFSLKQASSHREKKSAFRPKALWEKAAGKLLSQLAISWICSHPLLLGTWAETVMLRSQDHLNTSGKVIWNI